MKKPLKTIALILVAILVIPLILALFIKSEYEVVRTVVINKPRSEVFDYLRYLKNQDNFSVWNQADPNMKKNYTGEDGQVGFIAAWESTDNNVGTGEQEIKSITDGDRIDMELRFKVPFEATDNAYFTTTDAENGATEVKWGFNGKMSYPMNIMLLFMNMDDMLGNSLQDGLNNLKTVLESTPVAETPVTEPIDTPAVN